MYVLKNSYQICSQFQITSEITKERHSTISIIKRSFVYVINSKLKSLINFERLRMLPSPQSSLSSFRDYIPRTPEYQSDFSQQENINLGYRNFLIKKLFTRLQWTIQERTYWNIYFAFKKIQLGTVQLHPQTQTGAIQKLKSVLNTMRKKDSKESTKRKALKQLLLRTMNMRRIILQRDFQFCSWILKRSRVLIQSGFMAMVPKHSEPIKTNNLQARYIQRLSHAQLSISIRKVLTIQLKKIFVKVKCADNIKSHTSKSMIPFFKPKKEKHIHQHRIDQKIRKLQHFIQFYDILLNKINSRLNNFWLKCKKSTKKVTKKRQKQTEGDSLQIMNGVVKHMIFLTGKSTKRTNQTSKTSFEQLKILKLKNLLDNFMIKQRLMINECMVRWRGTVIRMNISISKQIQRLQSIKKQYVEQS